MADMVKPIKAEEIMVMYEQENDRWRVKMVLILTAVATAFMPFLLVLPIVVFSIWRRDPKDFRGEYIRKVDLRYLWTLFLFLISFYVFYFFVFPYVPKNDFPFWSVYPQIVISHDLVVNGILFAVLTGITIFLMLRAKDYLYWRFHPYLKYISARDLLIVPTRNYGEFIFDKINTGMMVVGAPGSGKTEWIMQIINQLPTRDDFPWIIFDPKGDYLEEFGDPKKDIILAVEGGNYAWNLFWEIEVDDPEDPKSIPKMIDDIKEIASELLSDEFSQDKYWINTARQIFFAIVYILMKESIDMYNAAVEEWEKGRIGKKPDFKTYLPSNQDLLNFLNTMTIEATYKRLKEYPEVRGIAEHINPEADKQAVGVWSVLQTNVAKLFIGSFGRSAEFPQMSIRDYIENPQGRKLFIEYDVSHGSILGPVYRALIDRAIKFSFHPKNKYGKDGKIRNKYFIIDEFQNVPKLNLYQNLVNYGRSFHLTSVIGIQTIAQVDVAYKKEMTEAIVAGHGYVFNFRAWDERTAKFVLSRLGKRQVWQRRPVQMSGNKGSATIGGEYHLTEYYPVSEEELHKLKPGECFLITPDGWKHIYLYPYHTDDKNPVSGMEIIRKVQREIMRLRLKAKKKGIKPPKKKTKKAVAH